MQLPIGGRSKSKFFEAVGATCTTKSNPKPKPTTKRKNLNSSKEAVAHSNPPTTTN